VPLDRAGAPGYGDARFDRLIVVAAPGRKALHGLQGTRGHAFEPWLETLRLALAHEVRKVLREVDGLGDLGLLLPQLGELVRLGLGTLGLTPQPQPGRAARRQGRAHRRRHARQGPPWAALPRREALRVAQAASLGRHGPITPGVAAPLELAKEPHRGRATRIPALEAIRCIEVAQTVPRVAAALAPRKRGGPEIALDCPETQPHVLGDRGARLSLLMQGPDLRMQGLPACLALHRALLGGRGGLCGWGHGHRDRPIGHQHGLLAPQGIHGIEGLRRREAHLVQSCSEIWEQVEAGRELRRCGRPVPGARSVGL